MKALWSGILLTLLAGCFGCDPYESYDWGDPVEIPDHPAFIANFGPETNTITVLDLDKEEIVGRRRVLPKRTDADDFAVFGKNELFFCIDWYKFDVELGDEIVIVDPSSQYMKEGSIETHPSPAGIYPISGDKAFLEHTFRSFEDSFWTTTLIDMSSRSILAEFELQDIIHGAVEFPDGRVYLFYDGWGSSSEEFMREFYSSTNSLGDEVKIENSSFGPYYSIAVGDSMVSGLGGWNESENTYRSIEIVQIPSCSTVASVSLTEKYPNRMLYLNNKLYVCHNNGGTMEHGNVNKVSVIDVESKAVIKVLEVCNAPCDIAYSAATNKIVVISGVGTVITIIDPETDSVTNTIVSDEVGDVDEWGYSRLRISQ